MSNKTIVTTVVVIAFLFLPLPAVAITGHPEIKVPDSLNPKLPQASELASIFSNYQKLSPDELRAQVASHIKTLANLLDNEKLRFQRLAEQIKSGSYLNQMTRREMQAILVLEDIKAILKH